MTPPELWTQLTAAVRGPMLIVLGSSLIAGGLSAETVEAAPNPLREATRTDLVTVAADGSYHVMTTTTIDLALDARWSFGNTIHDGFRLPETEALLPRYLRADYSLVQASIDGTPEADDVVVYFRPVEAVRIRIDADASELPEPQIDSGS